MEFRNGPSKGTAGIRGKDDERKLFVGGLPKPCQDKELREAFSKFGSIESINIKLDPYTGASRGFCFIVFDNASVVEQILNAGDIIINGKKVEPRKVTKSLVPGKIFIGGLTPEFTEDKIKDYFGQFGTITEIQWPFDKQKNQKKAYCFLTYEAREIVQELLKTPKRIVMGKELDVKKVKFNPETMWQFGGGAGAYSGRGQRGGGYAGYGGYAYSGYGYDYTDYDDYGCDYDSYYEGYPAGYDSQAYSGYAPRAPRGGRIMGGYSRHAPY